MPKLIQCFQEKSLSNGFVTAATVDRRRKRLCRRTRHLLARTGHWHCRDNESGCWSKVVFTLDPSEFTCSNFKLTKKQNMKVDKGVSTLLDFSSHFIFDLWKRVTHAKFHEIGNGAKSGKWLWLTIGLLLLWNFCCFCWWECRCDYCWRRWWHRTAVKPRPPAKLTLCHHQRKEQREEEKGHSVRQKKRPLLFLLKAALWWSWTTSTAS